MTLIEYQETLCAENTTDFSDLRAVIFNCTLKREEDESHTRLLLGVVAASRDAGVVKDEQWVPRLRSYASQTRRQFRPPRGRLRNRSLFEAKNRNGASMLPYPPRQGY